MTIASEQWDVLIRGGRVVDGTGNPWFHGDVALRGDRVAAVLPAGLASPAQAAETVDAAGMVVAPGFIDIQSHSIEPFLSDRRALSKVTQGVTTDIMGEAWTPAPFGGRIAHPFPPEDRQKIGPDFDEWDRLGRTWHRFGDWLADLERRGVSINVGSFVGQGTVREYAMGYALGEPGPDELATMRGVVEEAMRDGAFGLASALIYPPGSYAGTEELVALCEVVARWHGIHVTHMRSEEARILEALDETLAIARRTGVVTEIYHLKAAGAANHPRMAEVIRRVEAARAAGLDVTADMYPYVASGTGIASCLPPWAEADGKLWDNLRDPATRARIREAMVTPSDEWESLALNDGPDHVVLAGLERPEHQGYVGRRLHEVAADRGEAWPDTILRLLDAEQQNIFCFYESMSEDNLRRQMRLPWVKFSTDAGGVDPERMTRGGFLHPRAFGTYPRVLGKYVRDEGVLPLEDAVRKMSSAVADRLGLRDRGQLRAGLQADVVVFDPATVGDRATFADPHQLSVGVRDVWVNGGRVLRDGSHTDALPGRWVKGPGSLV